MSSHGPTHSLASIAPDLNACEISARQGHDDGIQPSEHLATQSRHPVAQSLQATERGELAVEPAAHLDASVETQQGLDVVLPAECVPQLLTSTVLDPREKLIRSETNGTAAKKLKARNFFSQ